VVPSWLPAVLTTSLLAHLNLLLLLSETDEGARLRASLRRLMRRLTGEPGLGRLRWWYLPLAATVGMVIVMSYDFATGLFSCVVPGSPTDIGGFLAQGQALWAGTNPFLVTSCGGTIHEPDGLASVLINAVGAPGGLVGIATVWSLVAIAVLPLVWVTAGPNRRFVTLVVATSPIYFPLVSSQIDGASNALVPVAVLLTLYLARRRELAATALGGFLASQRFPTLFPVLGLSGSLRRRWAAGLAAVGVFAAATGLSYVLWGSTFVNIVFVSQLGRRSFSLNFWGILLLQGWVPPGDALAIGQAVATVVLVAVVFFTVRSPLRAATITLVGVALLTQFLSFNILVWLLPVGLVGTRPRFWLWAIAVIGAFNYIYAWGMLAHLDGILWPAEVCDAVLTVLLLALFVDLWRARAPDSDSGPGPEASGPPAPTRIMTAPEVAAVDGSPSNAPS